MTSVQPSQSATGTDLVGWQGETGLEEFDKSDMTMPRLVIEHNDALIRDSQTDETFESLDVILLGLHKGRIMWQDVNESDEGDPPLCKSPDMRNGFPELNPDLGANKRFPFSAQDVYDLGDAKPIRLEDGRHTAPSFGCEACTFRQWNTDPTGRKPWCSEEWTFPLLYLDPNDAQESWVPALFTVRRSGIKATKTYVTPFASKGSPLFTVVTKLSLTTDKRGKVQFCMPKYTKDGRTDSALHADFYETFKSAVDYLRQMPMDKTDVESKPNPADESLDKDVIEGNVVDTVEAEVEPEPEAPKERVVSAVKIKQREPVAEKPTSGGSVQIDPDEEPPF